MRARRILDKLLGNSCRTGENPAMAKKKGKKKDKKKKGKKGKKK